VIKGKCQVKKRRGSDQGLLKQQKNFQSASDKEAWGESLKEVDQKGLNVPLE